MYEYEEKISKFIILAYSVLGVAGWLCIMYVAVALATR